MKLQPGDWTRRLITFALLLLVLPTAFSPRLAAKPWPPVTDQLAYSTQTGYFFFWDPSRLSLLSRSSLVDRDRWHLSDHGTTTDIQAAAEPGVTTAACVGDGLDQLAADPATVSLTALPIDGGGPVVPSEDAANFVLTRSGPGGREKHAGAVVCAEIVPGKSILRELVLMPARVFNQRDLLYVEADGVDLFTFFSLRQLEKDSVVVSIAEDTGAVVGTLATSLPCDTAEFTVLARGGSADLDFAVAPSSFTAVDENGGSLPVNAAVWSLPAARVTSSLALATNEIGLVRGVVGAREHVPFNLYYAPPATEPIVLATGLWDCGEAGAAPVPIDID